MYFDWITWSIWFIGLIILVAWIWVPIQEFKRLMARRKQQNQEQQKGTFRDRY